MHIVLVKKNPPTNAGDLGDRDSLPGLQRSLGGGNSKPLQYSCLENPIDTGVWRSTVHGVAKSQTRLKQLSTHVRMHTVFFYTYARLIDTTQYEHKLYMCWETKICV